MYNAQINQFEKGISNDNDDSNNIDSSIKRNFEFENILHEQQIPSIKSEDDSIEIYNKLKDQLDGILRNLSQPKSSQQENAKIISNPPCFQCISITFLDAQTTYTGTTNQKNNDLINRYQQSFRITQDTTVEKLKQCALELWDKLDTKPEHYQLLYIDDKSFPRFDDSNDIFKVNDLFLRKKSQIKIPQLLLVHESLIDKTNNSLFINYFLDDDKGKMIPINKKTESETFNAFIRHFSGVVQYINKKYTYLKNQDIMESKNGNDKKESYYLRESKCQDFLKLLRNSSFIWFILLFIFSLLNLIAYNKVYKHFIGVQTIQKIFGFGETDNATTFLENKLSQFCFNESTYFKPINKIRFTFYLNSEKECNKNFQNVKPTTKCNKSEYKEEISSFPFKTDSIEKCLKGYFNGTENEDNPNDNEPNDNDTNNYDTNEDTETPKIYALNNSSSNSNNSSLITYAINIIKTLSSSESTLNKNHFEGYYGTYHGKSINDNSNTIDMLFSLSHVSEGFLTKFLDVLDNSEPLLFNSNTTKAISTSMTLYDSISETYYYIGMLFELDSKTNPIDTKIIPFYPNLKNDLPKGKMIYILDIFRLILVIILLGLTIYNLYFKLSEQNKKTKNSLNYLHFLGKAFNLSVILDILLFIFVVLAFDRKRRYLYQDDSFFGELTPDSEQFLHLPEREYYPIAHSYELSLIYESIVFILLFLRVIPFFSFYSRIKMILHYLRLALVKISVYFLIYIILIIFFAIYAHVLIGTQKQDYSNYSSSLLFVLLLSLSHYDLVIFETSDQNYMVVFMFLFYIIVVFFVMSSFFGIIIESYRLSALKFGNNYSMRFSKKNVKLHQKVSDKKDNKNEETTLSKSIHLNNQTVEKTIIDEQSKFNCTTMKFKK